jgi:aldose 1-epimerase
MTDRNLNNSLESLSPWPSGRQHLIELGNQRAVVAEVGAAVRCYSVGERDVIVPFEADEMAPAFHGAVLLPWPNRLADGRYAFDGQTHQLPLTEPERQVALHGLVCWERWSLVQHTATQVVLRIDTVAIPGYPFLLRATIAYRLTEDGLQVELETTNVGPTAAPFGVGFHPWLSAGPGSLDDCTLSIDARSWVSTDDRLLPTGCHPVPEHFDFRSPRLLGATSFDDAFISATSSHGRSWVRLTGTDGCTASVWMDDSLGCWQICSGDHLPDHRHVRRGLAAEPMTCVADAFRSGERLIRLAPEQTRSVRWGLQLR